MKRLIVISIAFLFIVDAIHGQLVWKISQKDSKTVSYVFGTHHLVAENQIPYFSNILSLCDQSDLLIGEIDMSVTLNQEATLRYSQMNSLSVRDFVTSKEYKMLDNEFQSILGVGMSVLGKLKPMALISMHQIRTYMNMMGLSTQPESIDEYIQSRAKVRGKTIIPLETVDEQMDLLMNTIPMKRQAQLLVETIKNKKANLKEIVNLQDAYLKGDMHALQTMWNSDTSMTTLEKRLFSEVRNIKWLEELKPCIQNNSCFIAVGFMHLVGNAGLIQQLKLAGFDVEPVYFTN
jgi:uncharacterized protein